MKVGNESVLKTNKIEGETERKKRRKKGRALVNHLEGQRELDSVRIAGKTENKKEWGL